MGLKSEIKDLYIELGRDPNKINFKKLKAEGKLEEVVVKLKTIRFVFDLLFSEQPNEELQVEMLNEVFRDGKQWKEIK